MQESATAKSLSDGTRPACGSAVSPEVSLRPELISEAERFLTHRWVRRVQLCRSMGLADHEAAAQQAGPPIFWRSHLCTGSSAMRSGLLETLPASLAAPEATRFLTLWRRWDAENWGRALLLLADTDPARVCQEITQELADSDGMPRGPAVPWMLSALVRCGNGGRTVGHSWARSVRRSGVPLEYFWSGFFGAMAQMEAPGLALMVMHAFQAFEPGAREVDTVLESLFHCLAPGVPTWELVHGMRRGAGYLLEDLPELFEESSIARGLDGLLLDSSQPALAWVASCLPGKGRYGRLQALAAELVRMASLGRWATHADRVATFALAAACAECLRPSLHLENSSVPELLGLLSAEIPEIPGEAGLLDEVSARMEPRHESVLEKELEQTRSPAGQVRLAHLVRRRQTLRHVPWLVSLLGRKSPPLVANAAAGALVEHSDAVLPDLERAFDTLDFEGKGRCLDIIGFFHSMEAGTALARRLRGALADTELLDHWALAASYVGHQDLVVSARRWCECAPWPLGAMVEAMG